MPVTKAEVVFV